MDEKSPALIDRLPHGSGFRFLTRVVALRAKKSGEAFWTIDGSEPFFAGHFPGRPVVPGVLIAEALAQLSGLVAFDAVDADVRLGRIDLKFIEQVAPPADILLRASLARELGGLCLFEVRAENAGVMLAEGNLTLASKSQGGVST
ncbi:MAG: 3-hydroxyacyl-ACP dehydratase FabZ family protein [Phycisphaerales bacterium]